MNGERREGVWTWSHTSISSITHQHQRERENPHFIIRTTQASLAHSPIPFNRAIATIFAESDDNELIECHFSIVSSFLVLFSHADVRFGSDHDDDVPTISRDTSQMPQTDGGDNGALYLIIISTIGSLDQ